MAEINVEMLLRKVRNQGGRIAELELSNEAYAIENLDQKGQIEALQSQLQARGVAEEITAEGQPGPRGRASRRHARGVSQPLAPVEPPPN